MMFFKLVYYLQDVTKSYKGTFNPFYSWNISFVFYSFGYGLYTIIGNETKKINLPLFIK
jgi:hypothetical protein